MLLKRQEKLFHLHKNENEGSNRNIEKLPHNCTRRIIISDGARKFFDYTLSTDKTVAIQNNVTKLFHFVTSNLVMGC